jgi:hypothetical protein
MTKLKWIPRDQNEPVEYERHVVKADPGYAIVAALCDDGKWRVGVWSPVIAWRVVIGHDLEDESAWAISEPVLSCTETQK